MREITVEEMGEIEGGISWKCALALAGTGLSFAALFSFSGGMVAAAIAVGGFEVSKVAAILACA